MATKKATKYKPVDDKRTKGKVYKSEQVPFAELDEGGTIAGTFQGRKQIQVKDQISHELKEIWIYLFRDNSGEKFAISGRAMLDQTFEDVFEQLGGVEKLQGEDIRINRGDNLKTSGGFQMGTYEIIVLD